MEEEAVAVALHTALNGGVTGAEVAANDESIGASLLVSRVHWSKQTYCRCCPHLPLPLHSRHHCYLPLHAVKPTSQQWSARSSWKSCCYYYYCCWK